MLHIYEGYVYFMVINMSWKFVLPWRYLKQSYRKFPTYSDTQKIRCNHSKIWTKIVALP